MDLVAKLLLTTIVGLIIYTYAGYPVVLALVSIFKRRRSPTHESELPTVALIISAHNEDRIIRDKIENSLKLDYPKQLLRIIVASDGSSDDTDSIVREYESQHGVTLKSFERREGKSATLNKAVLGVEEDVLVFSDANAFYREDALRKLVRNFDQEDIGCVVGKLVYMDSESYVGKGEGLYWKYEGFLNRLESSLGSVLVATGTIFAIRRDLFRPVMKDVANDFQTPAEIASQGYGVVYEGEAVAFERSSYFFREEFGRKRRIVIRGLTGFNHLKTVFGGGFRIFQFISRKMLRWWVGPMLVAVYALNLFLLDSSLFYTFFLLQNAFYMFAIIGAFLRRGRIRSRIFLIPFYFVMVNAAALFAIVSYFFGGRFSAWEKAETTRDVEDHHMEAPRLRVIEGKKKVSKHLEKLNKIT